MENENQILSSISLLLSHSFGQIEIPDKVFKINVCFIDAVIILIDLYICHYSITN